MVVPTYFQRISAHSIEANKVRRAVENSQDHEVRIEIGPVALAGNLSVPPEPAGIVLFAHGSGSGRRSSRNRYVAQVLQEASLGTLLFDLLTEKEEAIDRYTARLRFDIPLLADRLVGATDWLAEESRTRGVPVGYFGASTGGGAALVAASRRSDLVGAVVSRGGRPDLAGESLPDVQAPTLLIVGSNDEPVIGLNEEALARLGSTEKELVIVPGATHLFEEPGKLDVVARLAAEWFTHYLDRSPESRAE
jgi:putative phosphoribosyl transferase